MCGRSSNNNSGRNKGATSSFGGYSFGHGLGSIADQRRAENRTAMNQGTNISNSPEFQSRGLDHTSSMGGPTKTPQAQTKPQGVLMTPTPVSKPRMTGVFGTMGIDDIKETEDAFEDTGFMGLGKKGSINVPDDYGWDFTANKAIGTEPSWSANRSLPGKARDMAAKAIGSPYDRDVTADRARDMLSRGKGTLSTWTEGLQEGNYQYDKAGNPAEDKLGRAYDMLSPITDVITGNPLGAVFSTASAIDTAMDHSKLEKAGVFGQPLAQHAPLTRGRTLLSRTMFGSGESGHAPSMKPSLKPALKTSAPSEKPKRRPRRGRETLMLTGPQGLTSPAELAIRRLFG